MSTVNKTNNLQQFNVLSGSTNRFVEVDPSGMLIATQETVIGKLSDASTISYLSNPNSWTIYGAYIGSGISNTYEGQFYLDASFYYVAYSDNVWTRVSRADSVLLNTLTLSYADGSILNIRVNYIPEASLNDTYFKWASGLLEPSIAGGTGDVTKAYVDGSLAIRDASITWLMENITPSTLTQAYVDGSLVNIRANYIPEVSLNVNYFKWTSGLLEPSVASGVGDVTKAYVDASLLNRDISISNLTARINITDVSLNNLLSRHNITETSVGQMYYKTYVDASLNAKANLTYVDASLNVKATFIYVDGSFNSLSSRVTITDTSLSGLLSRHNITETSLGSLTSRVGFVESSIGQMYYKTYIDASLNAKANLTYVDASLNAKVNLSYVDGSLSSLSSRITITDTSLNGLLSRHNVTETSVGLLTSRVSFVEASIGQVYLKTYVDASLNAKASYVYVDGSLNTKVNLNYVDGSLNSLSSRITITDTSLNGLLLRHNITETSLGSLTTRVGFVESSIGQMYYKSYIDASLNIKATYVYVDSSLVTRDTSIIWLFNNKVNNASLNLYETKANLDVSLANFSHNVTINKQGGNLASQLFFHSDQSINKADNVTFNTVKATQLNSTETERGIDSKFGTGIPYDEKKKFSIDVSIVGANMRVSMALVSPYTSFSYYINNKKFSPGTSDMTVYTQSASTAEGTWFYYINQTTIDASSPVMILTKTAWVISDPDVLLWNFYFDASANDIMWIGNEKHTYGRDIFTHARNHAQGAVYHSGLLFSQYNGLTTLSSNTDNNFGRGQVQIAGGYFFDEDIKNGIAHSDTAISATTHTPETDWDKFAYQFLGFTALADVGTNNTQIVFPTSRTLVTGQAITIMNGNTTTVRGTVTITTGGTGTTFAITIVTGTGFTTGDAIVVGARIPIYYISSVSGTTYTWRKLTTTDFLGVTAGTAITPSTIASATCQYNNATSGGFTNMPTGNRYFPVYLMATNFVHEPIIAVLGQGVSTSGVLATALAEAPFQFSNLVGLSDLGIQEIVPFYRLSFLYNTIAGFNRNHMRLADATFLNVRVTTTSASIISTGGASDHALLSNRQWDLSGHYGTPSYLASFAADGTTTYVDPSSLLADVTKAYVDGSLNVKTSFVYVDGSLSVKSNLSYVDASLNFIRANYIPEVSLNVNYFKWASGFLEPSIASVAADVTKAYVDGSLATKASITYTDSSLLARDISISTLISRVNLTDTSLNSLLSRHNITETSLGTLTSRVNITDTSVSLLTSRVGFVESSIGQMYYKTYIDASLNVKSTYVYVDGSLSVKANLNYIDGSLLARDTSINNAYTKNETDASFAFKSGFQKISVSNIAPLNPSTYDLWVDTSI